MKNLSVRFLTAYNKEVSVDAENAILVKCAAEYLKMNSNGKGGLCMFADNIIFDLLYLAKSKRDCKVLLKLLNEALKLREISERCKLNLRLLDSLVDYLSLSIKLNSNAKLSDFMSKDDLKIINNLPLNWFLLIIKPKLHINSYIAVISVIIQSYFNHDINLTSIILIITNIKLLFIHLNIVQKSEFLRCTQDVVTITQKLFRFKKYTRKGIFF